MAIKDLKARQGNVELVVDIVDVGQPREFEKFGKSGRVANAIAKDESGDIKLTLWNDDIEKIKPGDKVKISNGYVSEWQGELQLGTGKFGKLEVIGESEKAKEEETAAPNEKEDKEIYKESEKRLKEIEEKPEEESNSGSDFEEENVEDE